MSFFQNEFNDLRTKTEFETFVNNVTTYQQSQEYTDTQTAKTNAKKIAARAHICKVVNNHFNQNNQANVNVDNTDLKLYIGYLDQADRDDLKACLEAKGYICVLNEVGDRITISLTA